MNDSELLELAANAAGYELQDHTVSGDGLWLYGDGKSIAGDGRSIFFWSPLNDDGDAFRLAKNLVMSISICKSYTIIYGDFPDSDFLVDECLRRAIVRAAAEIGKSAP